MAITLAVPTIPGDRATAPGPDPADRPWVCQYAAGTPASIAYPAITLPALFAAAAARFADRPALVYYGRVMRFRELDRLSARFANRLRQFGLEKGDRALLLLPNIPQYPIAHFGILRAGGVVAPLSPLAAADEVAARARDLGARLAVVLDAGYDRVAAIRDAGVLDRVIVATPDEYLPWYLRLVYPLRAGRRAPAPDAPARGVYRFRRLLRGADARPPAVPLAPDDLAMLSHTGGTTGRPKAVMLTHRNLVANACQVRHWLPALRPGAEVELAIAPFFHGYGTTGCLHMGVLLGGEQVLVPRLDVAEVLAAIRRYRPTVFPGVPMLYAALCAAVRDDPARARALTSLRYCLSGAAPLEAPVQEEFERLTGAHLAEGYGLTECAPVALSNPIDGRARPGTIGLPLPDTEVRLVDPVTGEPAPAGQPGELLIRGPQVMRGYWGRPEETAAVLKDGWLATGDIATMDADGFFTLVERKKDVIITGGENIYPHEVEAVLLAHPRVQAAAVVGVSHPLAGQIAKAFIVPRPGATLTRREILQHCRDRLAKSQVPRRIEFRESLPTTFLGKVLHRALAEEERAAAGGGEEG